MKRIIQLSLILPLLLLTITLEGSVVVFDPTNFSVNVEQVVQHLEVIQRLDKQIRNQVRMLENWDYTQLPGLVATMERTRGAIDAVSEEFQPYTARERLEARFPMAYATYEGLDADAVRQMQQRWQQEQRDAVVLARTTQNRVYHELPAAQGRLRNYAAHSSSSPGPTAAVQAGNEITAAVAAQLQALQALEITAANAELQYAAHQQARLSFHRQRRRHLMRDWPFTPRDPQPLPPTLFPASRR